MPVRQLRFENDPDLRKPCKAVEQVDDRIRMLLRDMADTMHATENGAGLAANQVGILRQLVVIDFGDGLIQLVNPKVIGESGEQFCTEGCLSFPGKWGRLVRPQKVTVQALNEWGEELLITGEGERAKCLCHEIDHLNGILFTDKVTEWIR